MRRLLFFLNAYTFPYQCEVVLLFFLERLRIDGLFKKYFRNFILESRAILGFIYHAKGTARPQSDGMLVDFIFGASKITLLLRWHSSDFLVFNQVFIKEEYKPLTTLQIKTPVVIDAGANIGCTSIYLSAFYPHAKFIAIEPDKGNFETAKKNFALNKLEYTHFFEEALWHNKGNVFLSDNFRDKRNWSMTVGEKGEHSVTASTLKAILSESNVVKVDILKMDIEGAEKPIFENDNTLLDILINVKAMAIEIHEAHSTIGDKLKAMGFHTFFQGETLFAVEDIL